MEHCPSTDRPDALRYCLENFVTEPDSFEVGFLVAVGDLRCA